MAAIAGVLNFGERAQDSEVIAKLADALRHRGPEGRHCWVEGPVALVHCALVTTPESEGEAQPFRDAESQLAAVFDGRLDNRAELMAELKLASLTLSDTQLVAAAYRRWGCDAPKHLLGDFAFAIWDAGRKQMFCARDPIGAAGFAFYASERVFAFASETEALACLPDVGNAPNERYIAHLLVPQYRNVGDQRTWLAEVSNLRPGECLRVTADAKVKVWRYHDLAAPEPRRYASYEEGEAHFLSVFAQALRDRLRHEGDVAMMLSGGLDSAGILAMTHRLAGEFPAKHRHGYSALDDDVESCIESRSIISLVNSNQAQLHRVAVPSFRGMVGVEDLVDAAWGNAHPVANSILLPAMMCLAASRDGRKVLLHGASGDMALKGPVYYPALLLRQGRMLSAWRESRAASQNNLYLQQRSPLGIFARSAAHAWAPPPLVHGWRLARFKRQPSPLAGSLINPEFAARIHLRERLEEEFRESEAEQKADARQARMTRTINYVCSGMSAYNLVAGRYGVEVRDPWSDIRVLDVLFRMPDTFKLRDGWTKFPVRSAFKQEIEPFVRQRKDKRHVGWKMVIRSMEESRELLQDAIAQDSALIEEFVDVKAFRALSKAFFEDRDQSCYLPIFETLSLMFWLKRINGL